MPEEDIISSHVVRSELDCASWCVPSSTCVGFNYRPKSNKYAVNCQLSNNIWVRNQITRAKGEWMFYKDLEMVRKNYEDFLRQTNAHNYHLFTGTEGNNEFCGPKRLLLEKAKSSLTTTR